MIRIALDMTVVLASPSGANVAQIRKINLACLPVPYSESFYEGIVAGKHIAKIGNCSEQHIAQF